MKRKNVITVDLGAESGRVITVGFDGNAFHMDEVHRFANVPVSVRGTLHWDVLRVWQDIRTGIDRAHADAAGIGLDTWGVDFALLDRNGQLLGNPVHYRDKRTEGMMEWVFDRVPRRTLFERTGIQFMQINGIYQLASMIRDHSPLLDIAATFLTISDLFNYWLSGYRGCEFTQATTLQMVNPRSRDWDWATLDTLGVPRHLMPPVTAPGTKIGEDRGVPVLLSACHDTGSAVVGVPTTTPDYVYISSGTWSLIGMEISAPLINDASYGANVTNEGGVGGTFRLLKNVQGLWLAQQSRQTWRDQGIDLDYEALAHLAAEAAPFRSLIDPDEHRFLAPGDMPSRIQAFCHETDQRIPETPAQIMRTIYESLALKYRFTIDKLIALTGRTVERVHIVGGGSRNALLSQMTADVCNRVVITGPIEATALGNAIVQFMALGQFSSIAEAREVLSKGSGMGYYEPKNTRAWEEAYGRFKKLIISN